MIIKKQSGLKKVISVVLILGMLMGIGFFSTVFLTACSGDSFEEIEVNMN